MRRGGRAPGYAIATPILATLVAGQGERMLTGSGSLPDPGAAATDLAGGGCPDLVATLHRHATGHGHLPRSAYAAGLELNDSRHVAAACAPSRP